MRNIRKIAGVALGLLLSLSLLTVLVEKVYAQIAAPVSLEWDPSPDVSVTGYAVYYGVSNGAPAVRMDVGMSLTVSVTNLVAGSPYYFYVVAYNAQSVESDPSNVLLYTPPFPPAVLQVGPTNLAYGTITVGQVTNKSFQVVNT